MNDLGSSSADLFQQRFRKPLEEADKELFLEVVRSLRMVFDPEIPAKNMLETIDTCARPPRMNPTSDRAKATIRSDCSCRLC